MSKKFIIEVWADDDISEKTIDIMLMTGAEHCLIDIDNWDVYCRDDYYVKNEVEA